MHISCKWWVSRAEKVKMNWCPVDEWRFAARTRWMGKIDLKDADQKQTRIIIVRLPKQRRSLMLTDRLLNCTSAALLCDRLRRLFALFLNFFIISIMNVHACLNFISKLATCRRKTSFLDEQAESWKRVRADWWFGCRNKASYGQIGRKANECFQNCEFIAHTFWNAKMSKREKNECNWNSSGAEHIKTAKRRSQMDKN